MPEMPRLRAIRERKLMSQEELARRSGVHAATISRIEAQGTPARFVTIHKLARALGVKPEKLVGQDEEDSR